MRRGKCMKKPDCYTCAYRGDVPGDAHSCCNYPGNKLENCRWFVLADVKCHRENGRAVVEGVPRDIVLHSPDGYEWGYGGSGPSDLALNILLQHMPRGEAEKHHQAFKWEFVARLPAHGGTIKRTDIEAWIVGQKGAGILSK